MNAEYVILVIFLAVATVILFDVSDKIGLTCKLFGHKPHEETYSGAEYMEVSPGAIDGIGREHATLYAKCARCDKKYRAGQIHLPERHKEAMLKKTLDRITSINQVT